MRVQRRKGSTENGPPSAHNTSARASGNAEAAKRPGGRRSKSGRKPARDNNHGAFLGSRGEWVPEGDKPHHSSL